MSTGELLNIEPQELQFPFELRKQISSSLQLSNKTDNYVAFKVKTTNPKKYCVRPTIYEVKTTNPKKYCVRPNNGVVLPRSTSDVIVTMQGQKEVPPDMQCKDKFLLQSVVASLGATAKDITPEMFNKEAGHNVEECRLRVIYMAPPRPPSPVHEGSEEGASPRASVSENENFSAPEFSAAASRAFVEQYEPQDKSTEARALFSKLTEEKNAVIQQNHKLQQELGILRRQANRSSSGLPFIYVAIVGLIGIVLGYLVKKI